MKTNSAFASQLACARRSACRRPSMASSSRSPSSSTTSRVRADLDRRVALDLVDEVARHRLAEVAAADQQAALRGALGQEHRRLAGRVAAADDHDRVAAAQLRLGLRGGVVDAAALELARAAARRGGGTGRRWRSRPCGPSPPRRSESGIAWRPCSLLSPTAAAGTASRAPNLPRLDAGPLGQLAAGDARPGSRGSSRSAPTCRPGRRTPRPRRTGRRAPPRRRRAPPRDRRGRRRPRSRRRAPAARPATQAERRCRARRCSGCAGSRRRSRSRPASRPARRRGRCSSASASSSSSRSIHWCGMRLRARNSRRRRVSGEKREPISLMPAPSVDQDRAPRR